MVDERLKNFAIGSIIILFVLAVIVIIEIILMCLAVKNKKVIRKAGIDAVRLRKVRNLSILSLVMTLIPCSGCWPIVLPILALVFRSGAKRELDNGNISEAEKKADTSLLLLIISNGIIIFFGVPVVLSLLIISFLEIIK